MKLPIKIEWWLVGLIGGSTQTTLEDAASVSLVPNHAQIVDADGTLLLYCDANDEYGFGQEEIDRLNRIVEAVNRSSS